MPRFLFSRSADRLLLTLLSAVLLATALRAEMPWLALGALVPIYLACEISSLRAAATLGALGGFVYGALIATWIPDALQGLGASPTEAAASFLAISVWAQGFVFAVLGVAVSAATRTTFPMALLYPFAAAIVTEWVVSIAWWGVPWGLIGYSQVSGFIAAMGSVAVSVLRGRAQAWRWAFTLFSAWLALAFLGVPLAEALRPRLPADPERGFTLLLIQPDLPRGDRWIPRLQPLNLERVRRLTERSLAAHNGAIDAVALPENLLTTPLPSEPPLQRAFESWIDELGLPVVTGLVTPARSGRRDRYRSSVVWMEPERGLTQQIDKYRAIPVLESGRWFPGQQWMRSIFGAAARSPKVEESKSVSPLEGPVPLAVALCYELLYPRIVAERRSSGSLAILNLADDSWTRDEAASRNLTRIAQFRAIEQRLPVLRLTHGGLSTAIDPFGRISQELPFGRGTSMRVELAPIPPPRIRERLGILALPILTGLGVWWLSGRSHQS